LHHSGSAGDIASQTQYPLSKQRGLSSSYPIQYCVCQSSVASADWATNCTTNCTASNALIAWIGTENETTIRIAGNKVITIRTKPPPGTVYHNPGEKPQRRVGGTGAPRARCHAKHLTHG